MATTQATTNGQKLTQLGNGAINPETGLPWPEYVFAQRILTVGVDKLDVESLQWVLAFCLELRIDAGIATDKDREVLALLKPHMEGPRAGCDDPEPEQAA